MSLSTAEDYQFLVGHALKQKSPSASIVIVSCLSSKKAQNLKPCKGNASNSDTNDSADGDSKNSDRSGEDEPARKKPKKEL
ncbi:hypothetical protein PAXRUDRAFT_19822 [Paxillus rubicundulus Ve08.2h10]|uniref:Uncharacterized protein n=1 Tax=Paxillus rubicundulus Ve08.2h10 TaxID=930991 RepID=A0A0D0CGV3_9AGAM|nr:hypothetical protein PAXRUDRAFT_19822 [Paxillus rubicundulus Ve08.2h10]